MSKTKISQYDAIPGNNTDIDGINLAEGMAPGLVNNAIRELMSQLKDFQVGAVGDSLTVGGNLVVTGTATVSGRTVDAFPVGTKMLFQQSTAPVGWVKDTTHNDKALRVVTGTVSAGGTVGFSSAFVSKAVTGTIANATAGGTVGGTALSVAQLPSHSHSGTTDATDINHSHSFSGSTGINGAHTHDWGAVTFSVPAGGSAQVLDTPVAGVTGAGKIGTTTSTAHEHTFSGTTGNTNPSHSHTFTTSAVGSGSTHTHSFTGTAHNHTFTGTAIDLDVQYVDVIICTKS